MIPKDLIGMALHFAELEENQRKGRPGSVHWDWCGADMYLELGKNPEWSPVCDFARDSIEDALGQAMAIYAIG